MQKNQQCNEQRKEKHDINTVEPEPATERKATPETLPISHIIKSVLAAAIGVQSKNNQQKDFSSRQAIYVYLVAGVVFTTLFVLAVAYVVKTVLANAA